VVKITRLYVYDTIDRTLDSYNYTREVPLHRVRQAVRLDRKHVVLLLLDGTMRMLVLGERMAMHRLGDWDDVTCIHFVPDKCFSALLVLVRPGRVDLIDTRGWGDDVLASYEREGLVDAVLAPGPGHLVVVDAKGTCVISPKFFTEPKAYEW